MVSKACGATRASFEVVARELRDKAGELKQMAAAWAEIETRLVEFGRYRAGPQHRGIAQVSLGARLASMTVGWASGLRTAFPERHITVCRRPRSRLINPARKLIGTQVAGSPSHHPCVPTA